MVVKQIKIRKDDYRWILKTEKKEITGEKKD
jgi:hypothetical protein